MSIPTNKNIKHVYYNETSIPLEGGTTPTQVKQLLLGSSSPQEVTPDAGYALSKVTPIIDMSVIKPENIADGVSILGIVGVKKSAIEPYMEVTFNPSRFDWMKSVTLHGFTALSHYMFYNSMITSIELPDELTYIGNDVFYGSYIENIIIPRGVYNLGMSCFGNCNSLVSVTFLGKPSSMSSFAFNGNTKHFTINVPWSQGEVSGAPWGATNATINYNYTPST